MEAAAEEVMAATPSYNNKELSSVAKGKRTKRYRPHSPIPFNITHPTIAGEYDSPTTTNNNNNQNNRLSPGFSAPTSEESTTTEEEDTAKCLILLARGHFLIHPPNNEADDHNLQHDSKQNNIRKRHAETATTATDKGGGTCLYACKTCNRAFPSFQALGGHRASHKKPKNEKRSPFFSDEEDFQSASKKRIPSNSLSLQLNKITTAPRIHECGYCGAEFTSGQALGGHMRRHRACPVSPLMNPAAATIEEPKKLKNLRNGLSLDLNLPAPDDENQRFGFASRQQKKPEKLVLSTTTTTQTLMVDCHY